MDLPDVEAHPDVYEPAEDTRLLAGAVAAEGDLHGELALEVGTGTGLVALVLARAGARVVATDVNPAAALLARRNAERHDARVDVVLTDLAAAVRGPFDVVAFNPPYLPPEPGHAVPGLLERAFTGGPTGSETARRLLADLPRLLAPGGRALVLTSSRGNEDAFLDDARALGFRVDTAAEARFFFERLTVWRLHSM